MDVVQNSVDILGMLLKVAQEGLVRILAESTIHSIALM